jgi:4-hydroxybenzoate polyprenyltransferase
LDAPAVALLWQWMLARSVNARLRAPHAFVLGASVWLAYVGDRWIEGWRLTHVCTHRHLFYQRWRWPVAALWLAVLAIDVPTAVLNFAAPELRAGLFLLACVVTYLFSHQLIHRNRGWRAPKEVCVAVLMGGGVALSPVFLSSAPRWQLAPPLAFFMLLCLVNCMLISAWEREVDETHGETSIALQFRRGTAFGSAAPWVLSGLAAAFLAAGAAGRPRAAIVCAIASSASLGAVDVLEARIGRQLARVLADVALMTPFAALLWSWLR